MGQFNFNAQQYDPSYSGMGGLPPGKGYVGMIVKTSMDNTADGTGGFISLEIECLDGPQKGNSQIDRLNVLNKSPKAVEIANKQLSAYCHVTGQYVLTDTDQLCGKPFKFDVAPQKNNPEYTQIVAIYDINGNAPGKANPAQTQPVPAPNQPPPQQQANPNPQSNGGWNPNPPAENPPAQAPQGQGGAWTPPATQGAPAQAPGGGWGGQSGGQAAPGGWGNR